MIDLDRIVLLVTGGRNFGDAAFVHRVLDAVHYRGGSGGRVNRLIHGGAKGLDTLAAAWAEERGIETLKIQPDWDDMEAEIVVRKVSKTGRPYNAMAGCLRNQEMVDLGPDAAVVFPGGTGTQDCRERIVRAGIPYWEPAYRR